MEPTIHVRDVKLTPRLRNYVSKKTEKLDRYMPNVAELRVELAQHNARNATERQSVQLTLRDARGTILRAEERNADMFAAVDAVVDKMYRQIKRYRGKQRRNRKGVPSAEKFAALAEVEPLPIDDAEDMDETMDIVRRKRFAMQPMSSEEAIDQMELLGHDFFLFFNIEDESINAVYRRQNKGYGLLQPELE